MSTVQVESYPAIIGGERVNAGRTFEVLDPSTGRPCAEVARCGEAEIDQAVEAAREAHENTWRRTTPAERARVLHRIAELLRRDHEELARRRAWTPASPKQARTDATVAALLRVLRQHHRVVLWRYDCIGRGDIHALCASPTGSRRTSSRGTTRSRSVPLRRSSAGCGQLLRDEARRRGAPQPHQTGRAGPGSGTASWSPEHRPGLR